MSKKTRQKPTAPKAERVLRLTIKEPWFSMIRDGIKMEEYREDKPYWQVRLIVQHEDQLPGSYKLLYGGNKVSPGYTLNAYQDMRGYDYVEFVNGYRPDSPRIRFKDPRAKYGYGKPEWGGDPSNLCFVITWGERVA